MNKNRKKGFTLVELLVVIAILAILAVVSVVGYTSFTKKAKIADDISLTTQLNGILQGKEILDGEKNKYPHEAALELVDGGYDVTKITPTAEKYNYVYDLNQNRMFLLDESYNVVSPSDLTLSDDKVSVFGFAGSQDEVTEFNNHGYSVYLKSTYNSDSVTTCAGVDVGENSILKIDYINETKKNVVIRTASYDTTLNVYGPSDVVIHYGLAKEINIAKVANESYHEFGDVLGNITVATGKVEIESGANVSNVVIDKVTVGDKAEVTPTSTATKVKVKKNAKVNTVQSKVEGVTTSSIVSGEGTSNVAKIEQNDTNEAYIGSTGYSKLTDAIQALKDNSTLTLMKDVTLSNLVEVSNLKNITLDLNGFKISFYYNGSYATEANKGRFSFFTLINVSISIISSKEGGEINGAKADINSEDNYKKFDGKNVIAIASGGNLNIPSSNVSINGYGYGANGEYGITLQAGGTAILGSKNSSIGPSITSHFAAIGMNNVKATANLTIYGGTYKATANPTNNQTSWHYLCAPIYASCDGSYNLYGGTFEGFYKFSSRYQNTIQYITISKSSGITESDLYKGTVDGSANSTKNVDLRTITFID